MINTPENRLSFIMLSSLIYLLSPILIGVWLYVSLVSGCFPVDADSIGLPFAGFVLIWIIGVPFFIVFCISMEIIGKKFGGSVPGTNSAAERQIGHEV